MEYEDSTEKIVREEGEDITKPLSPPVPDFNSLPPGIIIVDEKGTFIYPPRSHEVRP